MKTKHSLLVALLALCTLHSTLSTAEAQGTAFTYQGRLSAGGSPANGSYDFPFALFNNNSTNTGQAGSTLTNLDVGVTNGLFTVTLDFGPVFTGNATWLAIGVRSNGPASFTALNPLQAVTPAPYAIFAPNAGTSASASSIAATNITGTISLGALPAAVVTNGESGVTLSGNGVGLTNLNGANLTAGSVGTTQLAGGALAAPVSGAGFNINAAANTSYVITNANLTTVNLPTNANVGDVVQITGEGSGEWNAVESNTTVAIWTETAAPTSPDWISVASSSDGTHLIASGLLGIYTSINSGTSWTEQTLAPDSIMSVASSSDGTHLVAVGLGIYTSVDSGTNWIETSADTNQVWYSVASSSDGTDLVAAANPGGIYTSANSGTNWMETAAPTNASWWSVASSSDGTDLVAAANPGGIYTSVNSGTNWMETAAPTNASWWSVASSSDGSHLVAVVYGGGIYTYSSNYIVATGVQGTTASMQYLGNGQWGVVTPPPRPTPL